MFRKNVVFLLTLALINRELTDSTYEYIIIKDLEYVTVKLTLKFILFLLEVSEIF